MRLLFKFSLPIAVLLICIACGKFRIVNPLDGESTIIGKALSVKIFDFAVVEKNGKLEKGQLNLKRIYTYDLNGLLIQCDHLTSNGSLTGRFVFIHNDQGFISACNIFAGAGVLDKTSKFDYDLKGHKVKLEEFYVKDNSLATKIISTIGPNEEIIEQNSYSPDNSLFSKTVYTYDKRGNETESKVYRDGELRVLSKYEYGNYDQSGNWMSRTYFENGKPVRIIAREIAYR